MLALLPESIGGTPGTRTLAAMTLLIFQTLHLALMLAETGLPHGTDNARYAARLITHGKFRNWFWAGVVGLGGLLPVVILVVDRSSQWAVGGASALALAGLLIFEWCFVMAGQSVPNS